MIPLFYIAVSGSLKQYVTVTTRNTSYNHQQKIGNVCNNSSPKDRNIVIRIALDSIG